MRIAGCIGSNVAMLAQRRIVCWTDTFETNSTANWTADAGTWATTNTQQHAGTYSMEKTANAATNQVIYLTLSSYAAGYSNIWCYTSNAPATPTYVCTVFRRQSSGNYYCGGIQINNETNTARVRLYKVVANVFTELSSSNQCNTIRGNWYKIRVTGNGTSLSCTLYNAASVQIESTSVVNATYSAAGNTGVMCGETNTFVDDFEAGSND